MSILTCHFDTANTVIQWQHHTVQPNNENSFVGSLPFASPGPFAFHLALCPWGLPCEDGTSSALALWLLVGFT